MKTEKIKEIVCKDYQLPIESIDLPDRKQIHVEPCQIAHYFALQLTKLSCREIGKQIGGKDHATVHHSRKVVLGLMEIYDHYRERISRIEMQLMVEALKEYQPKLTMNSYPERKAMILNLTI